LSDLGTIAGASGLESAINLIWAYNASLCAIVPANRLLSGRIPPSEKMPYVRLDPGEGQESIVTNRTIYATHKITFHIWSDGTTDVDLEIWPLIRNAFSAMIFDWGTGGVINMKWDGPPSSKQSTDPEIQAWVTTTSFTCQTWQTRTDATNSWSSSGA
jgi:hypothetical protein